ncbi:MAG: hypothetical protein AAGJ86_03095 [Pseudomonadota bacterium]
MFRRSFLAIQALLAIACGSAFTDIEAALPNQPTVAIERDDGSRTLANWSTAASMHENMSERILPDNPAFEGAEVWLMLSQGDSLETAAVDAFRQAGLQDATIIASTPCNPVAVDVLDASPGSEGAVVMVAGTLGGEAARGIGIVLFGRDDEHGPHANVHAFMAPENKFVALGGFAVPGVRWLMASTAPNEDMTIDGSFAPEAATARLSEFFSVWVEHWLIPMMAMTLQSQMQSIQSMASWNNAMSACAGDANCTVVEAADGSGSWEAVTR